MTRAMKNTHLMDFISVRSSFRTFPYIFWKVAGHGPGLLRLICYLLFWGDPVLSRYLPGDKCRWRVWVLPDPSSCLFVEPVVALVCRMKPGSLEENGDKLGTQAVQYTETTYSTKNNIKCFYDQNSTTLFILSDPTFKGHAVFLNKCRLSYSRTLISEERVDPAHQ